ncbi:hypothetical protein HYH03_005001 [Edaphochlamys debaryana]|uniref:Uncharacterized protein n=1 Tax=Edaphochlamys debaryana TaxID=47281 RepID=A0A835Y6M5_9CHLO|nr:hypothetical protein HYH03_005001 [Edaphochlamys debaryana]|eukprot:KAG2496996.1 hypothetical protein HYH03_005001 [Edaphochlamys debaryana]
MFKARASGFFVGFGVAGALAAYQLRTDILNSHEALVKQGTEFRSGLEKRVVSLEATVSKLSAQLAAAEAKVAAAAEAEAAKVVPTTPMPEPDVDV